MFNRNPAYTELLQSLLKLLVDTPLQWMVCVIMVIIMIMIIIII